MIRKNGGHIVKILRPSEYNPSNELSNHVSETSMKSFKYDLCILNISTISCLNDNVEIMIKELILNSNVI